MQLVTNDHSTLKPARPLVAVVCSVDISIVALLQTQIQALVKAGYDVMIICSDGTSIAGLREKGLDISTVTITRNITPILDFKALFKLYRIFRRRRPTLVHTHTPKAAFLGQLAALGARVPIRVNTLHGLVYPYMAGVLGRTMKVVELTACRLSHLVLSQSRLDVKTITDGKFLSPDRIVWIANGIDLERFDPRRFSDQDRHALRNELGIPDQAFVIGIVARMVIEKGFRELFAAFARFNREVPNSYLVHIGPVDRSRRGEITPSDADSSILDKCRFLGERFDVEKYLSIMDVFCLPSYREGLPRSVLEANAMGVPAVVTDVRGCSEVVEGGLNGILVEPRKVDPLVNAFRRLHGDTLLRQRMSSAAVERSRQLFNEESVFRKIIESYSSLLSAAGLPLPCAASDGSRDRLKQVS